MEIPSRSLRGCIPEARATSWIVSSDFTMRVIVLWFVESAFVIGVLPFGAYGEPA